MLLCAAGSLYFLLKHVIKPYDDEVKARLQSSLSKEIQAERLKTELITNVSHDLKTPLTAIINYSDLLLKRDENDEYAKVIYEKSRKLQTLTEDLFEVSKAQSGNISVTPESLSVSALISQTLAELDAHTVDFKVNAAGAVITADGRLMGRVFENLIGNIVKYSLPNTRAYIDAAETDGKVYITFKNIANYEMNFDAGGMTERFSRGDAARTAGGNGLGLAIAQSYVEACGGGLRIDTDGDLFKVTVTFNT
jgi:signal transduction histidine kinase